MGPQPRNTRTSADRAAEEARAAGLQVVDLREETTRVEFFDIAAVVHFLRKVVWTVPDFTVDRYREPLAVVHERIRREGRFVSHPCGICGAETLIVDDQALARAASVQ